MDLGLLDKRAAVAAASSGLGYATAAAASLPAGRLGDADDFGAIATFLCSEHARFLTGVALHVDGGDYPGLL